MQGVPVKHYRYGILVIHGIGFHKRGETIRRWAETLGGWFACWLTRRNHRELAVTLPELGGEPGAAVRGSLIDDPADGGAPAQAVLSLRGSGGDTVEWLLAESWWAEAFQQPKVPELVSWIALSTPFLLVSHLGSPLVRTWRRLRRQPRLARKALLSLRLVLEALAVPLAVPVSLLVVALLIVLLFPTLIPIAQVREASKAFATRVFGLLGDTFVVTMSPVRRDLVVSQVGRDINWIAGKCDSIAIIAHSQGGALAHDALRRAHPPELHAFITLGSGIQKLLRMRLAFHDGRALVAYAWIAPALVAAGATLFAVELSRATANWWLAAFALTGLLVGVLLLATAVRRLRRTSSYKRALRLPGAGSDFRWLDLYGSADPVPNGPSYPSREDWLDEKEVFLHASLLRDHTAYIHDDEGVLPLIAQQLSEGFEHLRFDNSERELVRDARWRRRLRTRTLSAGRILITLAVIASGLLINTRQLGSTVAGWLPHALRHSVQTLVTPLPAALRSHHAGGICCWIIIGLLAYILFVVAYHGWATRERKMFLARATRTNPLAGGQRVFFGGITLTVLLAELALAAGVAARHSWRVPTWILLHHPVTLIASLAAIVAMLTVAARSRSIVDLASATEARARKLFDQEQSRTRGAGESFPT
jgi:hypothetical protein